MLANEIVLYVLIFSLDQIKFMRFLFLKLLQFTFTIISLYN